MAKSDKDLSMTKKILLIILMLLIPSTLAACTPTNTKDYESLTQSEKQKVNIQFKIKKDNYGDEETPNPEYDVNMKVTNNTNVPISFDENKFTYVIGDSKNTSGQGEKIVVKPGQSQTTKRVFSRIAEQQTVGGAVINYDNKELVQANFANPSGSVTTNNNSEDNEAMNNTSSDINGISHHNTAEEAKQLLESERREMTIIGPIGEPIKEMSHSWIFSVTISGEGPREVMVTDSGNVQELDVPQGSE
mgnify:CR=1 FL=1